MPLFGSYPSHSIKLEAAGLEPALRFSISIMPALLAMPVDALLYPSNPQAGIELRLIFSLTPLQALRNHHPCHLAFALNVTVEAVANAVPAVLIAIGELR